VSFRFGSKGGGKSRFVIHSRGGIFHFVCESETEFQQWYEALDAVLRDTSSLLPWEPFLRHTDLPMIRSGNALLRKTRSLALWLSAELCSSPQRKQDTPTDVPTDVDNLGCGLDHGAFSIDSNLRCLRQPKKMSHLLHQLFPRRFAKFFSRIPHCCSHATFPLLIAFVESALGLEVSSASSLGFLLCVHTHTRTYSLSLFIRTELSLSLEILRSLA
jgi:hypothetical protein